LAPLRAAGGEAPAEVAEHAQPLTREMLDAAKVAALHAWAAAGATQSQLDKLAATPIHIAELSAGYLGLAGSRVIYLDRNAAGHGWYLDGALMDDNDSAATATQIGEHEMDLLWTLIHEQAHILGFHDDPGVPTGSLMNPFLDPGVQHDI